MSSTYIQPSPCTPGYVLEVIRDSYRHQVQYDPEAEPGVELSFDSTVSDWRNACDLLGCKPLGRALGMEWGFQATDEAWRQVLEPARQRRLVDVCTFIASRVTRPVARPSKLLGSACQSGGTFLAIREALQAAGANVEGLRPSSPVQALLNKYPGVFLGPVSRLAPNRLPQIQLSSRRRSIFALTFLGFFVASLAFASRDLSFLLLPSLCLALASFGLFVRAPIDFEFPGVQTFRDLVERMLGEAGQENAMRNPAHGAGSQIRLP